MPVKSNCHRSFESDFQSSAMMLSAVRAASGVGLLESTTDNLAQNRYCTQYQKAPTFTVSCELLKEHTYRKGAPL